MEWTPERRAEVARRLREGRDRAAAARAKENATLPAKQRKQPQGRLIESDLAESSFGEVAHSLRAVNPAWIQENVPDAELRSLLGMFRDGMEHVAKRIQFIENQRNQLLCDNPACRRPYQRHAGEIAVHDPDTGSIRVWRSCSEGCQRAIEGIAAQMRARGLTGRNQGVRAI